MGFGVSRTPLKKQGWWASDTAAIFLDDVEVPAENLIGEENAGFAGIMVAPILSVDPGMGDTILILAFVVIVIGGIGSIRGAFLAALLIGLVDTLGRSFSVDVLRLVMGPSPARTVGPAIASMLIYLLMAVVLYVRPTGLFPAKGR